MSWKSWAKGLLIVPAVGAGIIGFRMMAPAEQVPAQSPEPAAVAVRVETVVPRDLQPVATGYGRVEAARVWTANPQVSGNLTYVLEGLAVGSIVEAGERLVEIDRRTFEIRRDKASANLRSVKAQIAEIDQRETNTKASIVIEQQTLDLRQKELDRARTLVQRGTSAQATEETAERQLLAQQQALLNLNNTLQLYDEQREALQATFAVRQAELEEAERDLAQTLIVAPFDGRVTEAEVETSEFVRQGDKLLTIEGTEASEVTAELQPAALAPIVQSLSGDGARDVTRAVALLEGGGVQARVRSTVAPSTGSGIRPWPASIVRVRGSVDGIIGTVGIVVRIANPNVGINGERGPLANGTFVEVDILAPQLKNVLSVPRDAIRQDDDGSAFVYVIDGNGLLQSQPVVTGATIGGRVVVSGPDAGTQIVLSDPQPAIIGQRLLPVED